MTVPVRRTGQPSVWHPFRGFEDIYSEFDRLMQSVMGGSPGDGAWMPAADIVETDSAYVVEIELPGVRQEDANVELDGNELVFHWRGKGAQARGSASSSYATGRELRAPCDAAGGAPR